MKQVFKSVIQMFSTWLYAMHTLHVYIIKWETRNHESESRSILLTKLFPHHELLKFFHVKLYQHKNT